MELYKLYAPKEIETKPLHRDIFVHGMMKYRCGECGRVFKMWLESGVEDKWQDKLHPELHKPAPFTIGCLCGGTASHIDWHEDTYLPGYRPLANNMNYFENTIDCDHGVPHIRNDG